MDKFVYGPEDSESLVAAIYDEEMTLDQVSEYLEGYAEKYRQIGAAECRDGFLEKLDSMDLEVEMQLIYGLGAAKARRAADVARRWSKNQFRMEE